MQRILVTVSDGSLATAVGIHFLWRSLTRHSSGFGDAWAPVVLYPSWAWPPTEGCAALLRGQRILAVEQQRLNDPYAAKLVLADYVATLPDSTEVLYLDYDHVSLSQFTPLTPSTGVVVVGSRVGALQLLEGAMGRGGVRYLEHLRGRQFNNSLMHGLSSTMNTAMNQWRLAYTDLGEMVALRFREEAAFFASAMEARIDIRPIPNTVQAEWDYPDADAPLFHYGGDSVQALALKRGLPNLVETGGLREDCIALLRGDPAGRRILKELTTPEGLR